MAIDTSELAFPKARAGDLRVEAKRKKRLSLAELEREARAEARLRYGWKCAVPGCKEAGIHLHHIVHRSQLSGVQVMSEPDLFDAICQLDDVIEALNLLGYPDEAEAMQVQSDALKGYIVLTLNDESGAV